MTAVTPTDRPKSVRNLCVIEVFGGVFMLSRCFLDFSVGVWALVIGLSQISSFLFYLFTDSFIRWSVIFDYDFVVCIYNKSPLQIMGFLYDTAHKMLTSPSGFDTKDWCPYIILKYLSYSGYEQNKEVSQRQRIKTGTWRFSHKYIIRSSKTPHTQSQYVEFVQK